MYKVTKIKDYCTPGEYKPTAVDKVKAECQLLLKSCDPKIVHARIDLNGAAIKKSSTLGIYQVSNSAWSKLQTQYSWMPDF